jgi:hypothetical protein
LNTFYFFVLKLIQGANALLILGIGKYFLPNESFVLMVSFISLNALINLVDGGLSVNILHNAARLKSLKQVLEVQELYEITSILYKYLGFIYGIIALIFGLLYLNLSFDIGIQENVIWLVNIVFCVQYLRYIGEMTFLEGIDPKKKIIATKIRAGLLSLFLILIFSISGYFLILPSLMFLTNYLMFSLERSKFKFGLSSPEIQLREAYQIFLNKYLSNQVNLIIAWFSGYLAFHVTILVLLSKYEEFLISDVVFLLNIQTLALGFSVVFIQPRLNIITDYLKSGDILGLLNLLKKITAYVVLIGLILMMFGYVLRTTNFISYEFMILSILVSINWVLLSFIFFMAFILRSFVGERFHRYSLMYGLILCLTLMGWLHEGGMDIMISIVGSTVLYTMICVIIFYRELKVWMNIKII